MNGLDWMNIGRKISGARDRCESVFHAWALRRGGVALGPAVAIYGKPIVSLNDDSHVSIGARCSLISKSERTALGVSHPVILRTLRAGARLRIGNDVGLSGAAICAAVEVSIGDRVLLGSGVMISDTDFHPLQPVGRRYAPPPPPRAGDCVLIGDDVFIGARSVILKGVTIGEGTVVGAGSLVTSSLPTRVVAAGNPCRVLRSLE